MSNILGKANGYNEFSEGFKLPEMPERGTVVKFKILQEKANEIINDKAVTRYPLTYTFDPTSETYDTAAKRSVKIAIVKSVDERGNLEAAHKIRFNPHEGDGTFYVTIGDAISDASYLMLMLSKERERGDDELATRYDNVQPKYRLVDDVMEAKKRIERRKEKTAAEDHAKTIVDADLQMYSLVLGLNAKAEIEVMRDAIQYYAETMPHDYLQRVNDEDRGYRELFAKAMETRTFTIIGSDIKWTESGAVAVPMRTDRPEAASDEFIYFIKTNDIAKNMVVLLRKKVDETVNARKKKSDK